MDGVSVDRPARAHWVIDEIPFGDVDRDQVRDDRQLFYYLAAASFIEITADLYTANLVKFYRGDDEVSGWLSQQWEPEELQHLAPLKRYVETVWPEFERNVAYRAFFAEYSRCCGIDRFASTQDLELASRCVVEIGTATFYHARAHRLVHRHCPKRSSSGLPATLCFGIMTGRSLPAPELADY
jgi:hypothetical protein